MLSQFGSAFFTLEQYMLVKKVHYHQKSKLLDIFFENDFHTTLSAEFLRVYSPSAEVRGHGPNTAKLVTNKKAVSISKINPVGHYAVRLVFDDGHNSGLYSWQYLHQLATTQETLWQQYLDKLSSSKATREPLINIKMV